MSLYVEVVVVMVYTFRLQQVIPVACARMLLCLFDKRLEFRRSSAAHDTSWLMTRKA
jgi:hypothetical protein